ncbi:hypothetical protein [Methanosarcina sp. MTP4]|uniref:hypothetical protein n=1 Tax=Methanosarcina sp. MTP4 TaxID=1434100 RepID=UPI00064F2B75|nr:hypothetical protein [Methanosarcina sp. MTP4]
MSFKGFKFSHFLLMLVMVAAITLISGCEENDEARINESEEAVDNAVLGEYSPEGGQNSQELPYYLEEKYLEEAIINEEENRKRHVEEQLKRLREENGAKIRAISGGGTLDNRFRFYGVSTLPDGTCIRTRLFYGDEPVSWWPSGECAVVQDGYWEVSVTFGENGVPEKLETDDAYYLEAWVDGDPEERTEFAYAPGGGAIPEESAAEN